MKYKDLIQESLVGSEGNIRDMIQTIIMSLSSEGITDIPTEMIAKEIQQKTNIDVPYGKLMDIIQQMPMVGSATGQQVTLQGEDDFEPSPEEEAKDQVANMALGADTSKGF